MSRDLTYLDEPTLLFGHGQQTEDPRDGLTLFGPLDEGDTYGVRYGVIGNSEGIRLFTDWVERIQSPVFPPKPQAARPAFPGFETVFGIPWSAKPTMTKTVDSQTLNRSILIDDPHQRVFQTVELFSQPIIDAKSSDDVSVDIWFVIIPNDVKKYCRPQSTVNKDDRIEATLKINPKVAKSTVSAPFLFADMNEETVPYHYEVNFHNQLKARLLSHSIPTQIILHSKITPPPDEQDTPRWMSDPRAMLPQIAWNIATTTYYKISGRPWKIGAIRGGVCYVGIVFKRDDSNRDSRWACCAAQMFLDSGDGIVFKGSLGPWYSAKRKEFHLGKAEAQELVSTAVQAYKKITGEFPKELFLHGKAAFNTKEWSGFEAAAPNGTSIVGVRIRDSSGVKLYRTGNYPILRGLSFVQSDRNAFLWTRGYVPRLQTSPGLEVPRSLRITICQGMADIETVLRDILALTKLNYNSCIYGDGTPVTLKFADAIGEILTAGPIADVPPLPFKYYI